MAADPVLSVTDLSCGFRNESGYVRVVDSVSFDVEAGATLAIVGESGCGKTVSALAVMGLLPKPAGIVEAGTILFKGKNLADAKTGELLRGMRGRHLGMIFQEPMTALNPVHRIGRQLAEAIAQHQPGLGKAELRQRAIRLLEQVGIPAAEQRFSDYPHQLSGGMRQRAIIAMALAGEPEVLIADEPTTALDVTVQAQILELLRSLLESRGMAMIFITHDLGVVAELCDTVLVMYAGRVAEHARVRDLFVSPRHPYTRGLIDSIPKLDTVPKSPLPVIEGVVPTFESMPSGCRFSNRCRYATDVCRSTAPPLEPCGDAHAVACHHWRTVGP